MFALICFAVAILASPFKSKSRLEAENAATAEWVARQLTEAFPWNEAPRYLIRDQDRIYGTAVKRRLRAMGISNG